MLEPRLREELTELAGQLCKALNDPKRLMLLYALADAPHTVTELCEIVDATQSNVSQHLTVLRDRGLVESSRAGAYIEYRLRHRRVIDAVDILRQVMADEVRRRQDLDATTA